MISYFPLSFLSSEIKNYSVPLTSRTEGLNDKEVPITQRNVKKVLRSVYQVRGRVLSSQINIRLLMCHKLKMSGTMITEVFVEVKDFYLSIYLFLFLYE